MEFKSILKKNENWIIALLTVALLGIFAGINFDYYYDLNDDVLMKDILAGAYTGTPEGHNIQMLWLVSAGISLLYRIAGSLPWYGIFLCACHFGCLFLILQRSLSFVETFCGKIFIALTEVLLFGGLFLEHLIFVQYTVTCTLLGATAAFMFYTTDITLSARAFIKKNIPAVFLVFAAYLIRSEMLLLVLPMICVAGVAKWGSEKKIFTKEHGIKYFTVIGLILAGILIGQATHMIAYGSEEWKTFTTFFNNRTELYDFQEIPPYEENQDFYEEIGLSGSEKILFDNYNFGMDEEIDEKLVGQIAEYAGMHKSAQDPFMQRVSESLKFYVYRFTHGPLDTGSDYPWNYAVIAGYFAVFLLALPRRIKCGVPQEEGKKGYVKNGLEVLWKLIFLFAVRTLLWMYILMRGRDPERITHSLYLMELCILAAMAFTHWKILMFRKTKRLSGFLLAAVFGVLAVVILPSSIKLTGMQQKVREEINAPYIELYQYFAREQNADNFYLIDVYSTVEYSEKMFENVDNSLDNYDIMGGWACKSPIQRKKLESFGIGNMEQALKDQNNVYFVRKISEDMEWLSDYYEGHDTPVKITLVDKVAGAFEVYEVRSL
mgnify:FL=1